MKTIQQIPTNSQILDPGSQILYEPSNCLHRVSRIVHLASRIVYRSSFLLPPSLFLIVLVSCSPAKRLERLVMHHPELMMVDTMIIRDTVEVPGVKADTALHIDSLLQPVILEKERLKVTFLRQHDTLFVEGECTPDTIILERKIPIETIRLVKTTFAEKLFNNIPGSPWES